MGPEIAFYFQPEPSWSLEQAGYVDCFREKPKMPPQSKETLREAQCFVVVLYCVVSRLLSDLGLGPGNIGIVTETSGHLAVLCSYLARYNSLFIKAWGSLGQGSVY